MTKFVKPLCLLLALCALFLSACTPFGGAATPTPGADAGASPSPGSSGHTSQAAKDAAEALHAVDLDLFTLYTCSSGVSYQLWMVDPSSFGITEAPMTLGMTGVEADNLWVSDCQEFIGRLDGIDYDLLNEADKLSYDIMRRFLEDCVSQGDYYYFDEPLVPYTGVHSNLPMTMTYLPLEDSEDIDIYLALLEDFGNYFDAIIEFEREKSQRGLFMTDSAADMVIESCRDFLDSGANCFLIGTFDSAIDELDFLSDDEAALYKQRNLDAVFDIVFPAYERLEACIASLKGSSTTDEGLHAYEGGADYFANELRIVSCGNLSVSEAYALLDDCYTKLMSDMQRAMSANPSSVDEYATTNFTLGSVDDNIRYLRELIEGTYPELPAHEVDYVLIPDELADFVSPAAYLIPPIDDAYHNTIILNPSSIAESNSLLLTLAHEGYPGHLYQYVYQRNLDHVGLFAGVAPLTAYSEGWSQAAEEFVYTNSSFDRWVGSVAFTNSMITSVILPAIASIGVNAYGWDETAVFNTLAQLGMPYGDYANYVFELAVDHPMYILEYALGYAQYRELYDACRSAAGSGFDRIAFCEEYLSYGPAYFDMLAERMLG
ncbi:MAG: DUF885 family protein [Clostridia bacterium]|nr:DUF885 family protein [Clostridia bacterium]